jgi:hypothetical protein
MTCTHYCISRFSYGDIVPITPIGRILSCLCALFGSATIAVLVSVLVDRYQRVYARKLYIQEEIIDFHDYTYESNNDIDSKCSTTLRRCCERTNIDDENRQVRQHPNDIHFIFDCTTDKREDMTQTMLETIDATSTRHTRPSNEQQTLSTSTYNVNFKISFSSSDDDENENENELTESCS